MAPSFNTFMADLGITSRDDPSERAEQVIQFLPRLWEITEAILKANPDIIPDSH